MGYLLKEALKTLCGVNQWSYAVFWKIGCQNPKLLIWEECYYEPELYGGLSGSSGVQNPEMGLVDVGARAGNGLCFLINKMMMDNHVNVLGEGLIGRAAFTGSHAWILAEGYMRDAHPPEVVKEVCLQFSAGMRTIAIVPVLPHGVVQFGSYVPMMENVAFINDVKSLVLQLGCVPGVLLSGNFATKEPVPRVGVPVCPGSSFTGNYFERSESYMSTPLIDNACEYNCSFSQAVTHASQTSCSVGEMPDVGRFSSLFQAGDLSAGLMGSHDTQQNEKPGLSANSLQSTTSQLAPVIAKAEVLSSNPEVWLNKQGSLCTSRSNFDQKLPVGSSIMNGVGLKYENKISSESGFQGHIDRSFNMSSDMVTNADLVSTSDSVTLHSANGINMYGGVRSSLQSVQNFKLHPEANSICQNNSSEQNRNESLNAISSKSEVSCSKVADHSSESKLLTSSSVSAYPSDNKFLAADLDDIYGGLEHDLYQVLSGSLSKQGVSSLGESVIGITPKEDKPGCGMQNLSLGDAVHADASGQHCTGNDLFDILGVGFRNKLLNSEWNTSQSSLSDSSITHVDKTNSASFKGADASKDIYAVNQEKSDNSIFSGTSADHLLEAVISKVQPSVSCRTTLTNGSSVSAPTMSHSSSGFSVPGHIQRDLYAFPKSLGKPGSLGSCSFNSGPANDNKSSYSNSCSMGGSQLSSWIEQDVKPSSSVSTAYSKKTDEMSKTNRKRLKPGENPRPRPKDRQMIQDRVKELREIVPNGAKCSIDALLERTIKHMLFLQSVTKHADKLKQTGETKIISKDGGLLIKDNYDGGTTWAYEVGSQSMVCPIIVEDLNQPRQMLVEMLCEERGLFLEIADIIRGLGLTILKGIMETRNDKIWARFAVEANRDVTRMEIFISLVRLLEQTAKSSLPPPNCVDNDNMMAHQFQPATSIPASGRPCDL